MVDQVDFEITYGLPGLRDRSSTNSLLEIANLVGASATIGHAIGRANSYYKCINSRGP